MKSARQIVTECLVRLEQDKSYSNLLLDAALKKENLSSADQKFATRLFYGVIERKLTLDYIAAGYLSQPAAKTPLAVRIILWMGFYQLLYMDVPDSAAVNESVKLAARFKPGAKGLINAVLRRFIREGKQVALPDKTTDPFQYYSVAYSCPRWLVEQYAGDYGEEKLGLILETSLLAPPITVRLNPLKTDVSAALDRFSAEGIKAAAEENLPNAVCVEGNPSASPAFADGLFHVQDIASQLCALTVSADKPQLVFDLCAAPGGKSFTIAEEIAPYGGRVVSFDLHPHRVKLIQNGAKRLGLSNLSACVGDASVFRPEVGQADCVLCDVPCSGLGVIRRKPEIKYKPQHSLEKLPQIQLSILRNAANYVKPGGRLIYSTCSLSKQENEQVAEAFLLEQKEFHPALLPKLPYLAEDCFQTTIFPQKDGPDGFFLASFVKKNGD